MRPESTSSHFLLGITALGFLGVTATYLTAGLERFWANWLLWFLFVFTLALGLRQSLGESIRLTVPFLSMILTRCRLGRKRRLVMAVMCVPMPPFFLALPLRQI